MIPNREIGMRLLLVTLFISSVTMSGLWMSGYIDGDVQNMFSIIPTTQTEADDTDDEDIEYENSSLKDDNDRQSSKQNADNEEHNENNAHSVEQEQNNNDSRDSQKNSKQDEKTSHKEDKFATVASVATSAFKARPVNANASFDIGWDLEVLEQQIDHSQYPMKTVLATGYTAGYESTGKTPDHPQYGITYSGVEVRRDLFSTIAADLDVFPLGTILYIPGYGYGVVADIGGAIKGNKIDLYFEEVSDVFNFWGKRHVDVYVIQYGDGKVTEAMLNELNDIEHNDITAIPVFRPSQ